MKKRNLIADAFFEGIAKFSEESGAYNFESRAEYSGKGDGKQLTRMICTASYAKYDIEYVYTARGSGVFSMLTFRIIFDRSRPYIKYSPYDLMYVVDDKDFRCYYYAYIENPERMRTVTDALCPMISELLPRLDRLAHSKAALDNVFDKFSDSVNSYYGRDILRAGSEGGEDIDGYLDGYCRSDNAFYASRAYGSYLRGNYNAAYDAMRRMRFKTYYQIRLMSFMATLTERYEPVERAADTTGDGTAAIRTQILRLIVSMLIMTIPAALFFIAIYYLSALVIYRGSLWADAYYFPNALAYIGGCALPAMLASQAARRITLIAFPAARRKYLSDLDKITATNGVRNGCLSVMTGLFAVWAAVLVIASANSHAAFYKDGVRLPSESSMFSSDNYAYSDVEKLVHAEGGYDIYGKYRQSSRYVIVLKNGRKFYLSSELTSKLTEEKVVPIMEEHGVPVRTVHDVEDLDFEPETEK